MDFYSDSWYKLPDEYREEELRFDHEVHSTDYGPVSITLVYREEEEKPCYMKVIFRPDNLTSLIKRKFGFDTVQEFELGIAELEKLREFHHFSEDHDQMDKNLAFLLWEAEEEFGRNSRIHKAIGQIEFRRTIRKSDNVDLEDVYDFL